jgi:hypothetical protein
LLDRSGAEHSRRRRECRNPMEASVSCRGQETLAADDSRARGPAGYGRSQCHTNAGARRLAGRTPRARPTRACRTTRSACPLTAEGRRDRLMPLRPTLAVARGWSASSRGASRGERCRIEVKRSPLVAREERERLRFEDRGLVIVAGEGLDGSDRVEARERYEGDLVLLQTAQNVRAAEARDLPHRRKEFAQQESFVRVGVVHCRPATPKTGDHGRSLRRSGGMLGSVTSLPLS